MKQAEARSQITSAGISLPSLSEPLGKSGTALLFCPGLYLVSGARASGKTTTLVALAYELERAGVKVLYKPVHEPRGPTKGPFSNVNSFRGDLEKLLAQHRGYVIILDSITYVISTFSMWKETTSTFKEGLTLRDALGVLELSNIAAGHGCAVLGSVNSEIYPVVAPLEGACEGSIKVNSVGALEMRDRRVRQSRPLPVSREALDLALAALGTFDSTSGKNGKTFSGF
jgi:hypothetical protein